MQVHKALLILPAINNLQKWHPTRMIANWLNTKFNWYERERERESLQLKVFFTR